MDFKHTEAFNFEGAFRGMRNPMNSWDKSDSVFSKSGMWFIGKRDFELAQKLILAGSEHGKFMRQILVSVDITAPIFWWKEMDTYKVGTTANSTSTMHRLVSKPITEDDFEFTSDWDLDFNMARNYIVRYCEELRKKYVETKDRRYWRDLIEVLPQSYLQTRTWTANYAILRNIYFQRRNHKLIEWHKFCDWIQTLPYANELITLEEKPNETN